MLGRSEPFRRLLDRVDRVAGAQRTTLVTGDTGTGKELVAKRLHLQSKRADRRLVSVHCGAISESLVESELFGHVRGAFTGAVGARQGLLATADQGTLFLDEVNSLSAGTQVKLLRFLETREYRSVGSDAVRASDVWIIAATNRDLRECVAEGTFREDLMYRLDVVRIAVPSLKQRGEDVLLLAEHFLQAVAFNLTFAPCSRRALLRHDWPGNVRELKHRIEAAALLADGPRITADAIGLGSAPTRVEPAAEGLEEQLWSLIDQEGLSLREAVELCEHMMVKSALRAEEDNRTRAAQRLGIHVRTIFKKLAS